jgi:hypothetical protein
MRISPRPTSAVLTFFLVIIAAATCFAQNMPQNDAPAAPKASASTPQISQAGAPEAETDSADIPPFALGRISEAEYFALRDQEIRTRRGLDDLARNPQARSLAIRRMEFQEQFLRRAPQGLTPFSALIAAPVVSTWSPLGPAPIPNGQTDTSEVPVSGRVTAIVVDPANENTVYAGTAQGGVYRSLDGGNSWTPIMDSAQSMAIGAITMDPTDATTLFVGTGEGNFSGDSFFGVGVYVIQNANTVTPIVSGPFNSDGVNDVFTGRSIVKILVNPANHNQILVASSSGFSGLSSDTFNVLPTRGVYLSSNALSATPTFARLTIQSAANANSAVTDMAMDPGNPDRILVNIFNAVAADGGVWVSTSGSPWAVPPTATWTRTVAKQAIAKFAVNRSGAGPTTTFFVTFDEVVTCTPPVGPPVSAGGTMSSSVDGGLNWTAVPAATGFCGGQCFYDMAPAIDPTNVNVIYLGGAAGNSTGKCGSGIMGKSINGGTSFSSSQNSLHADSHATVIAPSNPAVIYAGNDGGIFRSSNSGATWSSVNTTGLNATQFVSLSVHPTDANFSIGGTQDNGTEFLKPDGTWTRADFGDGGYSAIDQNSVDATSVTMYHTYFNSTSSQIILARVTNVASASEGAWSLFGCPAQPGVTANGFNCADAVLFYAPIALGAGNPNTVYFGTDRLYRSADRGSTMTPVSQALFCCDAANQNRNFRVSAIGVSPQDDNVRIVGLTNGKVFATTTGANPIPEVTGPWAAKFIARVVIDPHNANTAYVTLDGYGTPSHVWKTTNIAAGAGSWVASSTGLPDVPVNSFAVDPLNSSYLYAGTDIGVFNSIDGGATWAAYGTGLPRVAVFDLSVHKVTHKVRIGTHGRGAWEVAAAANFPNSILLTSDTNSPALGAPVTFHAQINKGTGVPVPTGTVTFSEGVTTLGSAPVDGTGLATFAISTLPKGVHQVTAAYAGDTLYSGSTSSAVQVNVGAALTTTALGASSTNPALGAQVTLTATVNTGGNPTSPTGTVSFIENSNILGTTAVQANATATFQTSSLAAGAHTITAAYAGDINYASSTSTPVIITVVGGPPPDYSVNIPNGSATIPAGQTATYNISVTPQGGFAGTIGFACSGLPAASSCAFNPATLTPNGSAASTTLTISTTARSVASARPLNGTTLAALASFGFLGIVFLGGASRRKRSVRAICSLLMLAMTVLAIASCGGGSPPPPPPITGTPAGTFSVTVSATSGATTHTSVITLVVQ